jgi:[ribosomal protein S18]-alanine N-acetyltransferase
MNAPKSAAVDLHPSQWIVPMTLSDLDVVEGIEKQAYEFPWTRGNFVDSLVSDYAAWMLVRDQDAPRRADRRRECLGYYLAMPGVEEMHLLNITIRPELQGQGLARLLMAHLKEASKAQGAHMLWLEVRESNARARQLYQREQFELVGRRKAYYPAAGGQREDALVMRFNLTGVPDAVV